MEKKAVEAASLITDRDVGAVLHVLRLKRGITQGDLAMQVNERYGICIQQSTISKIENGSQKLDIELTSAIAGTLNFQMTELLEYAAIHAEMEREDRQIGLAKLEMELSKKLARSERNSSDCLKGAAAVIYEQLQKIMVCGSHPAGTIFSVKAIAKLCNCHISTARKAIQKLVQEGYAQLIGNDSVAKTGFNHEYLASIIRLRFSLEVRAIKYLIDRKADLSALRILNESMSCRDGSEVEQLASLVQEDALFHQSIFRLAGERFPHTEVGTILRHIIIGLESYRNEFRQKEIIEEHQNLIEAMQHGNFATAFRCLRMHMIAGAPGSLSDILDQDLPMDFEEMLIHDKDLVLFESNKVEQQLL